MHLPHVSYKGVIIDAIVFEEIKKWGLDIVRDAPKSGWPGYPMVVSRSGELLQPLHIFVLEFFLNSVELDQDGWEVVHHRNEVKTDARLSNLAPGSRSAHARHHASKRQKFSSKKKHVVGSLYRPHAPKPERLLTDEEKVTYERELKARDADSPATPHAVDRVDDRVEAVLAGMLPALRVEIDPQASKTKMPRRGSQPRTGDRLLGISTMRRGCTPGEAAFVRLWVKTKGDLRTMAMLSGLRERDLRRLLSRPPVDDGITNWRKFKRLPPPSSPKKLRVYLRRDGIRMPLNVIAPSSDPAAGK